MNNILDFVYTGDLKMTNDNALDLFMIADRLELTTLFFSCVRYIEDHVDVNNCLGKLDFTRLPFFWVRNNNGYETSHTLTKVDSVAYLHSDCNDYTYFFYKPPFYKQH